MNAKQELDHSFRRRRRLADIKRKISTGVYRIDRRSLARRLLDGSSEPSETPEETE